MMFVTDFEAMADIRKIAEEILEISNGDLDETARILKEEYGITPFVPVVKLPLLQTPAPPLINFRPLKAKLSVAALKMPE